MSYLGVTSKSFCEVLVWWGSTNNLHLNIVMGGYIVPPVLQVLGRRLFCLADLKTWLHTS